jgi:adenylylsulfate kinase-like enzyme
MPPHIIECAKVNARESQATCHLPKTTWFAALGQKGTPLRMTGYSGPGKTMIAMIAMALEDFLVKHYGDHVYQLDGDIL